MADKRWPHWLYEVGEDPDYRFSFASERTFLAWIRTALALLAAGIAMDSFDLSLPDRVQEILAAILVLMGMVCALSSVVRWARAERAMRLGQSLPPTRMTIVVAGIVAIASMTVLIVWL